MSQIQAVIDVLNDLNEVHQELLDIEHLKTNALTRNETDEFVKQIHRQKKIVDKVSLLEQTRMRLTQHWLSENKFENDHLSLADLIKLTPSHQDKKELNRLGEQLQARVKELRRLNNLNEQLIEQSLSYIELTLRLFTNDPSNHLTYGRNNEPTKGVSPQRGFFDSRA